MKKTILVTGKNTTLGNKLIDNFLNNGYRILAAVEPDDAAPTPDEKIDKDIITIPWNTRSPLSARNLVLSCLNTYGNIDEAVIIYSPGVENRPVHELPAALIEEAIDVKIKSLFFILKEILSHFQLEKKGSLSFLLNYEGNDILPPLEAAASGGIKALINSLFPVYQNEPVKINGFESSSPKSDEFADFVIKILREKGNSSHGKWYKYSEKGKFFSMAEAIRKR